MDNAQRSKLLNKAVDLLYEADALMQQAMGAGEVCYAIHNEIENAAEEIVDVIIACDEDVFEALYNA